MSRPHPSGASRCSRPCTPTWRAPIAGAANGSTSASSRRGRSTRCCTPCLACWPGDPVARTRRDPRSGAVPAGSSRSAARLRPTGVARLTTMSTQIRIAQDEAADQVLSNDPFALLVGMLLDQQYPMEHAFRGPWKILDRFGTLSPDAIAAAEAESFADLCATPPAIHRYGRSMAGRVQQLATVVRDQYDGRAETIWTEA